MEKAGDAGEAVCANFYNFFCTFLRIFAQFVVFLCIFAKNCKKPCKFVHFFAIFLTFMRIFAHVFCANISSSKIVSVLFFTLFPTLRTDPPQSHVAKEASPYGLPHWQGPTLHLKTLEIFHSMSINTRKVSQRRFNPISRNTEKAPHISAL